MELKPCPFCGKEPFVEYLQNQSGSYSWSVICVHDGCPADTVEVVEDDKAFVIEQWNTRAKGNSTKLK